MEGLNKTTGSNDTSAEYEPQSRGEMEDMDMLKFRQDKKICCLKVRGDSVGYLNIAAMIIAFFVSYFNGLYISSD